MGVRGLTTYINSNHEMFLKKHYLHDTNLVIDGHSLCAQLYRNINTFSAFGGDYDKFGSYIRSFFKSLRKCNVTPFILFDGCHETRKLKTIYSRLRSKLRGCSHLDPVTQDRLHIFPFLIREVFREVLIDMKISYTVCEFEADDELASLARHLNCPILSYDSDFFIYNVQYIPFNMLELKPKCFEESGNKTIAMECKMYKVQYLCNRFGGLEEELLPLLATLLGNDYVEKRVFKLFFSQLKLQKSKKTKNEAQRSIHTLFHWLQNETLDTAIPKILGRLKKRQKDKVREIIKKSINAYHNTNCPSLKYFDLPDGNSPKFDIQIPEIVEEDGNSESESSEESSNEEEEIPNESEKIPSWVSVKIRQNQIPPVYLNLYAHHLYMCNPQAEDYSDQDSFFAVLPIVRFAFDILTDFSEDSFLYVGRENCLYQKYTIDKEYAIPRPLELSDSSFKDLTDEQLKTFFFHFFINKLPVDWEVIEQLPSNFRLFMISLLWWIANCSVPANHVHSLIISYIMLEVVDEKTGTPRSTFHFNQNYGKKIEELKNSATLVENDELFLNKNKVLYEDCLIAAGVLLKHFEIDASIRKKPKSYDIKKIHSFAQFQCTLLQVNSLNILCGSPFPTTLYSKCYNGTLVYNIALKLENQADPVKFLEDYLKGASTIILFYKSICGMYMKLMEKMNLSTVQWSKRRRGRNKKADNEVSFIVEGFESDLVI